VSPSTEIQLTDGLGRENGSWSKSSTCTIWLIEKRHSASKGDEDHHSGVMVVRQVLGRGKRGEKKAFSSTTLTLAS
jgi:hypothetical protein